ncbi:MAG: CRTAC1 family protein [Gemmataceae bacterium]|nr:CRTAC1 family protein [Gemmataceae bacterium]
MQVPKARWFLAGAALFALLATIASCSRDNGVPLPPANVSEAAPAVATGPAFFKDVTADTGIAFTYRNGQETGHYAILESLGGGVGLIDFDGDGLLDIFAPGGGFYAGKNNQEIRGHPCKLFKNLGNWKFKDVTAEAGLERSWPYTHGCAVADYDRDGWPDLLVTGWGGVLLFHNVPRDPADAAKGRTFIEVAKKAGLTDPRWSTSAGWADFDGDGDADLYICHYVDWSFDNNPPCSGYSAGIAKDVCPPTQFKGLPDVIYRNNGDGTFTDMSATARLRQMNPKEPGEDAGKGLGVVIADFNGDRRPDMYVANDTVDNFLYINRGQFEFAEDGRLKGVARDLVGKAQGSMGVDIGDYDGTGLPSIFVTNYENENHALYRNLGQRELFLFSTTAAGIASIGQRYVGWGTNFVDVDYDGWLDIVIVNGHVIRHPVLSGVRQKPVLFYNIPADAAEPRKGRKFVDITKRGGDFFNGQHCGRGLAVGDLDNDGWPDFVVSSVNEPLVIQRSAGGEHPNANHWLGIELKGTKNRDLVGVKIAVEAGGRTITSFGKGGSSYGSAHDPRHRFGLGQAPKADRVTVTWPSGQSQTLHDLAANRYVTVSED